MPPNYDKISLTARLTAYMRQFSDIPFAQDAADYLHAGETVENLIRDHAMTPDDLHWYAPVFEIRNKSITETIRKSGIRQILELASGLTLRGLAMTTDPAINYVETDLEGIQEDKVRFLSHVRHKYAIPDNGNLHMAVANALDAGQLQAAVECFRPDEPIAVVHEGLLQYLSPAETLTVAGNVRDLLARFGGMWITPDFALKADFQNVSQQRRKFHDIIAAATDRRMYTNAFSDRKEIHAFFERLGLNARIISQVEQVANVVSVARLNLPPQLIAKLKPALRLWLITLSDGEGTPD